MIVSTDKFKPVALRDLLDVKMYTTEQTPVVLYGYMFFSFCSEEGLVYVFWEVL